MEQIETGDDNGPVSPIVVRPVAVLDRAAWEPLFAEYRGLLGLSSDADVVARVWQWLHDPDHEIDGLVAEIDGEVVGFTHCRRFAHPAEGAYATWLDDLFTVPDARGQGVGRALIEAVSELASTRRDKVVRWMAAPDNATAKQMSDDLAVATEWVIYDRAT